MNVLSVFDGMSCGRIALERAGIPVDNYYASEIDRFAISVSSNNYPDIIRLGDVRELDVQVLPHIDLLIGGSPCTNFSFAGKRAGMTTKCKEEILDLDHYLQLKQDGFEFVGQSYLFWEYMRIKRDLQKLNPKLIFLLENVMMSEKWKAVLSNAIGHRPIMINSALVSAQNRKRLYWTNIEAIEQPEDKGIMLRDILETGDMSEYEHTKEGMDYMNRTVSGGRNHWDFAHHSESDNDKSACLTANMWRGVPYNVLIDQRPLLVPKSANIVGRRLNDAGKREDENLDLNLVQCLETAKDPNKSRCLSSVSKDTLVTNLPEGRYPDAYNTLEDTVHYRKLTPLECERLQTVPDNYTAGVSNSQRYKMLGNGWTVDVIAHMFRNIPWFLFLKKRLM